MEDLLGFLVRALVRDPDAVEITQGERRGEPTLRVMVAPEDRGVVIGREGRTIKAITTVLRAAATDGRPPGLEVEG
ncbi:MAG: KH domain-containing protein [Myxococcales bacterium]|nr:KH domain-containing protein [Myxococcales bacterium]MCB9545115.1 KH domain-containing protein [Myxococcales bacterium]